MRFVIQAGSVIWLLISTLPCSAVCLPISGALDHIGETRCVTGKVFRVELGDQGIHYLDFCEDRAQCPFTVVIFPSDLRYIGDVRHLAGKTVEIHGPVTMYDNHAEIVLNDLRQLKGEAAQIPPLPKTYDVERKGRYSAGTFSHPKAARQPIKKRQKAPISPNDPSDAAASLE